MTVQGPDEDPGLQPDMNMPPVTLRMAATMLLEEGSCARKTAGGPYSFGWAARPIGVMSARGAAHRQSTAGEDQGIEQQIKTCLGDQGIDRWNQLQEGAAEHAGPESSIGQDKHAGQAGPQPAAGGGKPAPKLSICSKHMKRSIIGR